MRVGLHRGECIVGNLGGHNRFEYTAIGDTVNLASRLEACQQRVRHRNPRERRGGQRRGDRACGCAASTPCA
jgi:hypothetical protein